MNFVNLFITFNGRVNRAKFWLAVLVYFVINVVMTGLVLVGGDGALMTIVSSIISLLIAISGIAVGVKRLHDRNKSGWWLLLFYGGSFVLFGAGFAVGMTQSGSSTVSGVLLLLALAITIWSLIELGCLRGTIGQNQYGPDPLAPEVLTPPVRTHA
jgi:uncharacterized membrane protein YhaH (DUF805 family)